MTHALATLATLTLDSAAATLWDAHAIGAAPCGIFVALGLARAGAWPPLAEREAFPRDTVCGGCVSRQALALLRQAEFAREMARWPGVLTRRLGLYAGARATIVDLFEDLAVRQRSIVDAMLVDAALAAGAAFFPSTIARVAELADDRQTVDCRARDAAVASCATRMALVVGAPMRVPSVAPGWSALFVRLWNRILPLYRSMTR